MNLWAGPVKLQNPQSCYHSGGLPPPLWALYTSALFSRMAPAWLPRPRTQQKSPTYWRQVLCGCPAKRRLGMRNPRQSLGCGLRSSPLRMVNMHILINWLKIIMAMGKFNQDALDQFANKLFGFGVLSVKFLQLKFGDLKKNQGEMRPTHVKHSAVESGIINLKTSSSGVAICSKIGNPSDILFLYFNFSQVLILNPRFEHAKPRKGVLSFSQCGLN